MKSKRAQHKIEQNMHAIKIETSTKGNEHQHPRK
jgi:hypothetical protein